MFYKDGGDGVVKKKKKKNLHVFKGEFWRVHYNGDTRIHYRCTLKYIIHIYIYIYVSNTLVPVSGETDIK